METLYAEVVIFSFSLFCAGLFAFLETGFTALRLFKVKELEGAVARYTVLFESWEKEPQRILITILVANNFAHVLCSALITEIMQKLLGDFGLAAGVALATILILIFGDIIPKTLAKTHHENLFVSSIWIMNLLVWGLYPVVTILIKIADLFFILFGGSQHQAKAEQVSEKEIEFLIDYSDEKGIMETEKSEMLQNVFGLGQTPVSKIMVPKNDIVMLNVDETLEDAMERLTRYGYSRLPLYEGKEDNILGIVYHKDIFQLISQGKRKPLRELARPVVFVPATKKSNQLLSEFLKKRMHLAMVVDEYGAIIGLVTLEDVIEEIVGEISDEHEVIQTGIVQLEQGGWIVDATVPLEDLEEYFNIKFVVEDSATLGGFLSEKLQHLPKKGERVYYSGYCFQVQQASLRRVLKVLIFEDRGHDNHAPSDPSLP